MWPMWDSSDNNKLKHNILLLNASTSPEASEIDVFYYVFEK